MIAETLLLCLLSSGQFFFVEDAKSWIAKQTEVCATQLQNTVTKEDGPCCAELFLFRRRVMEDI